MPKENIMKTNITGAFKMRNLIKAAIADKVRRLERSPFMTPEGEDMNLALLKGESYGKYMNDILVAHEYLAELNAAIDKANVVNRKTIHDLDALKAKLSILNEYEEKAELFTPVVKRTKRVPTAANPYNEVEVVEKYYLNFDPKVVSENIKTFKVKKLELEDEVTRNNAITETELSEEFEKWYKDFIA